MKSITPFFLSLALAAPVFAQTISIASVSASGYCVGDTMVVSYETSGSFGAQNMFTLQLSDASGSFANFKNASQSAKRSGSLRYAMSVIGKHYRARVISSDPPITSSDNGFDIDVEPLPIPKLTWQRNFATKPIHYYTMGFVGDMITFRDTVQEAPGSSGTWKVSGDRDVIDSNGSAITVTYRSTGFEQASISVMNPNGCKGAASIYPYFIASRHPKIPRTVHMATGTYLMKNGDSIVLARAGANVTLQNGLTHATIYAEPNSSIQCNSAEEVLIYLLPGAAIQGVGNISEGVIVHPSSVTILPNQFVDIDTLITDDLSFDMSDITGSVVENNAHTLSITQTSGHLLASGDDQTIEVRLMNLLGQEVMSQHGFREADVDTTSLPSGVYIAIAESGGQRLTKKIAIAN